MHFKNCDIYQLKKSVHRKKLICFGKGQVLKDFLEDFSSFEYEKDIFAITDNKVNQSGKKINLNGHEFPLITLEELKNIANAVILISCADIAQVYNQLNQFEYLENVDCYAVYFVRSQTNKMDEKNRCYPPTFRITKEQRIPKKIHYCWFGKKNIPECNLKWMESWKRFCPDYEIIRWDESNYDITKNAYMYEAYKEKKWGFVSDYARVDIVYNHGGIYLDTDVELLKSYDELLYQSAFCGVEASRKIALGLGFGAEKRYSLIKEILNLYDDMHFLDGCGQANLMTCVRLQYPYYKRIGFDSNGNYQIINGMTVYPEVVFSPKDLYTREVRITEKTFSIHHYEGSWANKKILDRTEETVKLYGQLM